MKHRLRSRPFELMLIPGLSGHEGRVRRRIAAVLDEIGAESRSAQAGIMTDNSYVHCVGEGAADIDVGLPLRLSHSSLEVCDLRDLEGLVRLHQACLDNIRPDFSLSHDREPP